jgi:hypothetical protein
MGLLIHWSMVTDAEGAVTDTIHLVMGHPRASDPH